MKSESRFIATLIATAKQRVARQIALVETLEQTSAFTAAERARGTLRIMNARLEKLYRGRSELVEPRRSAKAK